MTKKELNQLYYLKLEIQSDTDRLRELRESVDGLKAQALTGMPGGGDGDKDKLSKMIIWIEELEERIAMKRERAFDERCRLEEYILSQQDSYIRQILTYRFIDCYSWVKIANELGGTASPDTARKALDRWISENS